MKDILPSDAYLWQEAENKAKEVFNFFGYKPIRTPIIEELRLFNRSLGNETEIVQKQMFVISGRDEEYCLRPEGTAAVVRAYLENNLYKNEGFIKLYYMGPMFRAERPQKGRLRQFHHIGAEALGADSPYLDTEMLILADAILKRLGIADYLIKINSLGCLEDKKKLSKILGQRLKDKLNGFCVDCRDRFKRNVFRILDCKNEQCKKIVSEISLDYPDYLCTECDTHFKKIRDNLQRLRIAHSCQITLVRGLDYYTRTVFEISHPSCGQGAQDSIGAGGRYDQLIAQLGGPELGAIGFALGVERLLLAGGGSPPQAYGYKLQVAVITMGTECKDTGFTILDKLRQAGIASDMDYENKSLKAQMRRANDQGVKFAAIIGEDELNKNVITLKDMESGSQCEFALADFIDELKKRLQTKC